MIPATSSFDLFRSPRGPARARHVHGPARLALSLSLLVLAIVAALHPTPAVAARTVLVAFAMPQLEGTLNLNTATPEQLDLLPGVGPSTADKIVRYREKHAFRSVRQLTRVEGIGPKTLARLRPFLTVQGESTLKVVSPG